MARIAIPLLEGLRFSERNAQNERLLDVTYGAKHGVLSTRKAHNALFSVATPPRRMISSVENATVYSLSNTGVFYANAMELDSGYDSTNGAILIMQPNSDTPARQLFIAGGAKMRKFNGATFTQWGIDDPPATPIDLSIVTPPETFVFDRCDDATHWVNTGATSVTIDGTTKQEGAGSLAIALAAGVPAFVRTNFGFFSTSPIPPIIKFWCQLDDPASIKTFVMMFNLALDGFTNAIAYRVFAGEYNPQFPPPVAETINSSTSVPQTDTGETASSLSDISQIRSDTLPAPPKVWKRVIVNGRTFHLTAPFDGMNLYSMGFYLLSTTAQFIHIDDILSTDDNQNDGVGARYKYAYESSATQHHGNLNATPSVALRGENNVVQVSGFQSPPSGQGIDTIRVFRDVNSDGNYHSVGTLPVAAIGGGFDDTVPVDSLGDIDTNDNSPPPSATIATEYKGSVWLNDLSNATRVWRSTPGRYESFSLSPASGFFSISGSKGDEVVAIVVIRGHLYIVTHFTILEVLNADATPIFSTVATVGAVSTQAYYSTKDFLVFAHTTGVYTFDGANLHVLPQLESLFDPLSTDTRRVGTTNLSTLSVGSDARNIWFTYTDLAAMRRMFTYSIEQKLWVEESVAMLAHETDQVGFNHVASDGTNVYAMYASAARTNGLIVSREVELESVSYLQYLAIEHSTLTAFTAAVFVDNAQITNTIIQPSQTRRWSFVPLPSNTIGQFVRLVLGLPTDEEEIYAAYLGADAIMDTVHYDTGYIDLGNDIMLIDEMDIRIVPIETGSIHVQLEADSVIIYQADVNVQIGQVFSQRVAIIARAGQTVRIQLNGARMFPVGIYLQLTNVGNGQQHHVAIPNRTP